MYSSRASTLAGVDAVTAGSSRALPTLFKMTDVMCAKLIILLSSGSWEVCSRCGIRKMILYPTDRAIEGPQRSCRAVANLVVALDSIPMSSCKTASVVMGRDVRVIALARVSTAANADAE